MVNPEISLLQTFTPQLVDEISKLLPELTLSNTGFGSDTLRTILNNEHTQMFLLRIDSNLAGMLTLADYPCPTGRKWWIEDVVISSRFRGNGLGRQLIESAINYVQSHGGGTLMLTSRPSRIAANGLYVSEGFSLKETNVYRLKI